MILVQVSVNGTKSLANIQIVNWVDGGGGKTRYRVRWLDAATGDSLIPDYYVWHKREDGYERLLQIAIGAYGGGD